MYDGEVVISRVRPLYSVRIYGWWLVLGIFISKSVYNFALYGRDGYWGLVLVLLVTGLLGRIFYVGKIECLTVTPDHMIIDYVGSKPQEVIDYTQIASNRNLSYSDRGSGYKKQLIDLDDGRQLIYTNMKFENYTELKNHIYQYMVAANQKGPAVTYHI